MRARPLFVLGTIESDAHTWNLVYLELLLSEQRVTTINMGPCVGSRQLIDAVARHAADALVVSTVNGHGALQLRHLIRKARRALGHRLPPVVVGGKLAVSAAKEREVKRELSALGCSGVFIGEDAVPEFLRWLQHFKRSRRGIDRSGASALRSRRRLRFRRVSGETSATVERAYIAANSAKLGLATAPSLASESCSLYKIRPQTRPASRPFGRVSIKFPRLTPRFP
jgi:methylaspartate mutase sigma subunit